MKHFPIRVGLCGIVALVAGDLWAQQEPPLVNPATPAVVQPGQRPVGPIIFMGEPLSYVRVRSMNDGPCGPLCPQPIFRSSTSNQQDIAMTNALVARAVNLGNFGINTKKIADVLDRGLADTAVKANGAQANNQGAGPRIQLAAFDPQEIAQAGKDAPNTQLSDEISRVLKTQGDLLRSMDIGALYRPAPGIVSFPPGSVGGCVNGVCYSGGGCAMVLTGRTGLELAILMPQSAEVLNLPPWQGLYLKEVYPKTPAEDAGFKRNDVLIEFDGKKVPASFIDFLDKVFRYVKNDTPINSVVLRAGQRVEINGMKVTDRRVIPPLPHECPLDAVLPQVIQVVPGINSVQQNTVRTRELRAISRPGGITEFIWVDPTEKR